MTIYANSTFETIFEVTCKFFAFLSVLQLNQIIIKKVHAQLSITSQNLKGFELLDKPFGHGKGSIRDCLNGVLDGKYSNEEGKEIIDHNARCKRADRPDNRDLPPDRTIGYLSD